MFQVQRFSDIKTSENVQQEKYSLCTSRRLMLEDTVCLLDPNTSAVRECLRSGQKSEKLLKRSNSDSTVKGRRRKSRKIVESDTLLMEIVGCSNITKELFSANTLLTDFLSTKYSFPFPTWVQFYKRSVLTNINFHETASKVFQQNTIYAINAIYMCAFRSQMPMPYSYIRTLSTQKGVSWSVFYLLPVGKPVGSDISFEFLWAICISRAEPVFRGFSWTLQLDELSLFTISTEIEKWISFASLWKVLV